MLASLAGGVLLLLVLAQIILPRIAASRISSRVGRYGSVKSVSVSAWPAIELLWGHVDSVTVHAGALSLSTSEAAKLLWEGRGAASMDLTADAVKLGSLRVTDAVLRKRGSGLTAHALASEQAIKAALPEGFTLSLLSSEGGKVEVRAGGSLFGIGASVDAVAEADDGKLIAHPLGFLVEGFRVTLFSDPHVHIEGVGASKVPGSTPTYLLSVSARLR